MVSPNSLLVPPLPRLSQRDPPIPLSTLQAIPRDIAPECAVREHVARLFFSQSIRLTRADGDGFLFCNRCAVRRFTLLMKRGTLQSSTASYFDCGSFRFAETGQTKLDLHPRA